MADKNARIPHTIEGSPTGVLVRPYRDESDGTYTPVNRTRLEAWDAANSTWIKVRANPKGQLLTDKGGAGADSSFNANYTTVQSSTIAVSATSAETIHVTAVVVCVSNAVTVSPMAQVKVGSNMVARHPGMPAGGGFAVTDIDLSGSPGDSLTVSCDVPTTGSIDFTVHYWKET